MDPTARAALQLYATGRVNTLSHQKKGYSNRSYRVDSIEGAYLFREFLNKRRSDIEQEFCLLASLKKNGIPTAHPIKSSEGLLLTEVNERLFALYPFLGGAEPPTNRATAFATGEVAGRLSLMEIPAGFNATLFGSWKRILPFVESEAAAELSDSDLSFLRNEAQRFEQTLPTNLPIGVVHADLFPDNVLFQGETLHAVLDFEEAAVDTLLLDVGVAINGFCFKEGRLDEDLMDAFLTGYEAQRPLITDERAAVGEFIRYGLFGILFWHISTARGHPEGSQALRIAELTRRYRTLGPLA